MNQFFLDIKISNKLIISGLALLIPLLLLLQILVTEKNLAIDFSQKEVDGIAYLAPLSSLVTHVPQHRGLSFGYLSGNTSLKEKIARKASEIEEDIKKVDVVDKKYGELLSTSSRWDEIKRGWVRLKAESLGFSAQDNFSRHTAFIGEIITLIQYVGDQSKLILDPNPDSYYLIDAMILKLPVITEQVGRLRGMGSGIITRNEITETEKADLLILEGSLHAMIDALSVSMAASVTANADMRPIQAIAEQAIEKLHHFEKILEGQMAKEAFNLDPQAYFAEGTEVISAFFRVYDEAVPVLGGFLETRIDTLKATRQSALIGTGFSILVALFIGWFTARVISKPLGEMTDIVRKVAKSDLSGTLAVKSKDEVGLLAQGFTEMLNGLKTADAQKDKMAQVLAMVEHAESNFIFADIDFNVTYLNPATIKELQKVAHLLPCAVDDIVGKSIDIFHKDPTAIREILSDPNNLPYSAVIRLGDEMIDLIVTAIFDHENKRIGTMAHWEIVTESANLKASLEETTVSVASASEELATASREMQNNAEHTTLQAQNAATISSQTDQNVQSVAAAAEEMSVTVKEISRNVHTAHQITEQAVAMAESMNETIIKLDASNSEIGNVVKVISMIAGQTNLLALNATIEAARAGDAGKGFAVVANEVKELAKGTSKATDEIRQQIVAIQDNTKGAVESIEKITAIIKENNSITTSIASAVEQQSMTTNEISLSMAEAAKETKQVVEELEEIIATSQNMAASAVNIGEASEELSRTAGSLSNMTSSEG